MATTFINKMLPTDASKMGIVSMVGDGKSKFAQFHYTFLNWEFLCNDTSKVKTKGQIFWKNPIAALKMAKTLKIPANYTLVPYQEKYATKKPIKDAA